MKTLAVCSHPFIPQEKVINMASPTDIRKGRVIVYQGATTFSLEMLTALRKAGWVCANHAA